MNGAVGHVGVLLGLFGAAAAAAFVVVGLTRRSRDLLTRGWSLAHFVLAGTTLAAIAMEHALITHDFSIAFVAANNARETPLFFSITGLWSELQGSILLWVLILGGYISFLAWRFRARRDDPAVSVALVVTLVAAIFFLALMVGPADPFAKTIGAIPADGAGPNALLQDNLLVAIHPPLLYLGYVGFTVPFAFAIAALITGRVGEGLVADTRRFTIASFGFLSCGIVLGAWWSYDSFGWGGFWGWDPVENAALLPWLTATAYLHSSMVQERRGLLRIWNLSLLVATYALTILGTFLTRSDIVNSIHAFSSSGIGPPLLAYFGLVTIGGVALIGWRGDRLSSPGGIDAPISREGAFLVNNLLFALFALIVLIGTVFPLFVQAFSGESITIGRPYFDEFTAPIGIALLFFMAVAPALPWRHASAGVLRARVIGPAWVAALVLVVLVAMGIRGLTPLAAFGLGSFAAASALRQLLLAVRAARQRGLSAWRGLAGRANGGMVVHLGVVVIAAGIAGSTSFGHEAGPITLNKGASVVVDQHRLTFAGWESFKSGGEVGTAAQIAVDGRVLLPRVGTFDGTSEATSTPGIASGLIDDVYVALTQAPSPGQLGGAASIDVFVQPLIAWLWIGGGLIGLGSLLALAPGRRRRALDPVSAVIPELADDFDRPPVAV